MEASFQLHASISIPPRKERPVPIGKKAGWASKPVWMLWRREISCPYRELNLGRPALNPSIYLLSYPFSDMVGRKL
jgi:hypothetical protein